MPVTVDDRPTRETAAAAEYLGTMLPEWARGDVAQLAAALIMQHDRLMQQAGADIYARMLQTSAVASPMETMQLAICSSGYQVRPAVEMPSSAVRSPDPDEVARAERAAEIAAFVTRCLEGLATPMTDVLRGLCDALPYGHRVAEIVYRAGSGIDAGRMVLDRIAVKPPSAYFLVVSRTGELLGLRANDRTSAVPDKQVSEPVQVDLPRWKFLHVAHRPQPGDPRGTSVLMPAYHAWFALTNVRSDHFKFLRGFGNPFIIGRTAPNREIVPPTDPVTGAIIDGAPVSGVREMLTALEQLARNNIVAMTAGAEVSLLQSSGNGDAFTQAFDGWKRDIHEAILGTAQATTEAKSESRSSKDGAADVMQLRVAFHRIVLCEAITRDVLRILVTVNYGEQVASEFTPRLTMATSESRDLAKLLPAFAAALREGLITEEQLPWVWEYLGIDGPDGETWRARLSADVQDQLLAQAEAARILDAAGSAA
jgi:hypothetical protein